MALGDFDYTSQALSPAAEPLYKAARTALKTATELVEKKDFAAGRTAYLRACFLDTAAANVEHGDGEVAAAALEALEELHEKETAAWTKEQPVWRGKVLNWHITPDPTGF